MEVTILDPRVALDPATLARLEEAVFGGEGRRLDVELVVVDDAEIRRVNRDFLSHDRETDVIAFALGGDGEPGPDGEILVNAEQAEREATARGHAPEIELLFYVAHGLLHLLGYDDASRGEQEAMHSLQRSYLAQAGVEVPHTL